MCAVCVYKVIFSWDENRIALPRAVVAAFSAALCSCARLLALLHLLEAITFNLLSEALCDFLHLLLT